MEEVASQKYKDVMGMVEPCMNRVKQLILKNLMKIKEMLFCRIFAGRKVKVNPCTVVGGGGVNQF